MQGIRDDRIDFFRGLALVFIFWDHIPGNVLGDVTIRNFGLSDAAEMFVFLAGYVATLAYRNVLLRDGFAAACGRILRRAWTLYIAHIFLLVLLIGAVSLANSHVETRDFVQEMHLAYFVSHPEQAMIEALTLRFKPHLMDPLPLYIILMLAFAAMLPLLVKYPLASLAASGGLYALALHFDWNLPSETGGGWFFNPLAWQFLFFLGGVAALYRGVPFAAPRAPNRWLLSAALVVLALSAALVWTWGRPELHDALIAPTLGQWLYPIDKTNLDPLRLIHFLSLAYCTAILIPRGVWLDTPLPRQIRLMGRHSLEVFCLGVLLAPIADALCTLAGDGLAVQITVGLAGVAVMTAFAALREWGRHMTVRKPAQA
ncbi:OpgC family protein [Telmatospirillum sp. J64-1]|uniref:OpgC family protein n=1 Tax=Telmatospirillum sp. J64-1 TaxID=2502183 RepID=UPI00115F25E9|nr:OpgC domain-containing protein [Telmatospirillum sp. J64-1]